MFSNNNKLKIVFTSIFISMSVSATDKPEQDVKQELTFQTAIKNAQQSDPWLKGNVHQQHAIESMGKAVSSLPDPQMSIGLANLPIDGFDFSQEAMTQAKIGLTQMFPRGDTLDIKNQQFQILSEAYPYQRQDREAKIAVSVGSLWLDGYRVQKSITLIEKNRSLFEQLADVAEANYSSALGQTRQQDIVRAQLEITRLEERLDKLRQQKNKFEGMLSQWLVRFEEQNQSIEALLLANDFNLFGIDFGDQLPQVDLKMSNSKKVNVINSQNWQSSEALLQTFQTHPAVMAIDKKVSASKTEIRLAEQKYKPEWVVNASYGYRDNAPSGTERSDFFSIGITFDLPLFTENRQDQEVGSAISKTEAVKTEKLILLRQLLSAYSSAKGRLQGIKSRQTLYKSRLLPQIHDHAEASLSAYTNDDGDFTEVVRSRIAVLNTEIDELNLDVEEQQLNLELNYLFIGNTYSESGGVTRTKSMNLTNSRQITTVQGDR